MDCSFTFPHVYLKKELHKLYTWTPCNTQIPYRVLPCFAIPKKRGLGIVGFWHINRQKKGFKSFLRGFNLLAVCLPVCRSEIGLKKAVGGSDIDFIQYHSTESARVQFNSLIVIVRKYWKIVEKNNVHKLFLSPFYSMGWGLYRLKLACIPEEKKISAWYQKDYKNFKSFEFNMLKTYHLSL